MNQKNRSRFPPQPGMLAFAMTIAFMIWQLAPRMNAIGFAGYFLGLPNAGWLMPKASPGMNGLCAALALSVLPPLLWLIQNGSLERIC